MSTLNNIAFIDGNNLRLTYKNLEIDFDYDKFITYLGKRHNVITTYYFIGKLVKYQHDYDKLTSYGYTMKHREPSWQEGKEIICNKCNHTFVIGKGVKCDCDADIVLQVLGDINYYDKAILITSDGDFDNLVKKLIQLNKLDMILAPCKAGCSSLLIRAARGRIAFLDELLPEIKKY